MQFEAAWSSWMTFVLVMMVVGPTLRMVFGSRWSRRWSRYDRFAQPDPEQNARIEAALAERDTVIEDLQRRLSEMEGRLDFTERLIATRSTETPREPLPVDR